MMTEDEARQRWCPFARVIQLSYGPAEPAHNRTFTPSLMAMGQPPGVHCIASECMAWRLGPTGRTVGMELSNDSAIQRPGKPEYGGYCGLAGRS